jgi:hypothetical protein
MNRRNFLITAGITGLTASYNNISFSVNQDNNPNYKPSENSVIYLFLNGGPTHIETFNPIPTAPSDRRSIIGSLKTNVNGMEIGGLWNNLSKVADKFCIVRSFAHSDPNHESAVHWMMTGERTTPNSPPKWPSYGSVILGQYGTNNKSGLPNYVKLSPIQYDAAAWMGTKYMGYGASGEGVKDLILKDENRFQQKLKMLDIVEKSGKLTQSMAKSWTELREQAVGVLIGKASEAFMVEKDAEYQDYSKDQLGKDILTAIRLVERGVKFVTINYAGWDMHQNITDGLKSKIPALDTYLAKYLKTAEQRQLNHKNMLVMTGDFGRTPKINKDGGRDHWPSLVPLWIANDSYDMGRIIGTSDANAERADQSPLEPEDLKWTIFEHVGINKSADWYSIENRPMMFVKESAKNILK